MREIGADMREVLQKTDLRGRAVVLAATTLSFLQLCLSNAVLYPRFDAVMPLARDMNVALGLVANLLLLLVATRRPRLLHAGALAGTSCALALAGMALTLAGVGLASPAALCIGTAMHGFGGAAVALVCSLAQCSLPLRTLLVGIPAAYGLSQAVGWLLVRAPSAAGLAALALCQPLALVLAFGAARRMLAATQVAPAQADAQLLHPGAYLPLTSKVYAGIFVTTIALGFNLRFGAVEGSLDFLPLVLVTCAAMAAFGLRKTSRTRFDTMFGYAVTLVVAGFLTAPLASMGQVTLSLIAMGGAMTNVAFSVVLTTAAARNPASGVAVFSWGSAVSSAASIVGANVGAFVGTRSDDAAFLLAALVAVCLVLYVLVGMRGFSFDETIAGITPLQPLRAPETSEERLERICAELGASSGLTPRETQVLALLARGRNNAYIQEELTLTRNTVKTYVKRIYGKLGVHSQQEVIDLVDER